MRQDVDFDPVRLRSPADGISLGAACAPAVRRRSPGIGAFPWCLLAGLALAWAAAAQPLRVTTWRLDWRDTNTGPQAVEAERKRARDLASTLKRFDADVILLQDVKDRAMCDRIVSALKPELYRVAVCSAFKDLTNGPRRQVAVLTRIATGSAWAEEWKGNGQIDSPGGFAFAALPHGTNLFCLYAVQMEANAPGDPAEESNLPNLRKREQAARYLLHHLGWLSARLTNQSAAFVIAGDFNTDPELLPGEATLRLLEGAGFRSAFQPVPPAYRITQPGRGRLASATFDYILGRNVAFESPPQIGATRLTERLPLTCDLAFYPSPVPPVVEPTFWRRAQALFAQVRWQTRQAGWLASVLGALVAGMAITSLGFRWHERRRRHGVRIITTDAGHMGGSAGVGTFSASSPEPGEADLAVWQTRALQAEEMVQQAAAMARARLTPHLGRILKEKAVAWLHSQRTQLLNSHESGTAQVLELEQRLSQIQWRFEEALTSRDRRIADLEQELAAKEKILHDVLQSQVGLAQQDRE